MNNNIIERLKKLLALAKNNPSQIEAEAAMVKAQAVAIEHGIDLAMLGASHTENETEIIREDMEFGQRLPTVTNYVCDVLISFFNVKIISSGGRNNGRRLIFVGKRDDVHTAKYIYNWLAETMVRCWHNYQRSTQAVVAQKRSYLLGFHNGLTAKLKANKHGVEADRLKTQEDINKYALAIANNKSAIDRFMEREFPNLRKTQPKKICTNADVYAHGVSDGGKCNIGNRAVGQLAY